MSPGGATFVGAWLAGVGIARLTGAAAVVLLLVGSMVAFAAAAVSGWFRLRRVTIDGVVAPELIDVEEDVAVKVAVRDRPGRRAPLHLDLRTPTDEPIGGGWAGAGSVTARFPVAGVHDRLVVRLSSAGAAGIVWWQRSVAVEVDPIKVAPHARGDLLEVESTSDRRDGDVPAPGIGHGEIDGIRPWREGDADHAVHWPSTMRAGELIVRDRTTTAETRWVLHLDRLSTEAADERLATAERVRHTLEEGLHRGCAVTVVDGDDETPVRTPGDAARIAARVAASGSCAAAREPWYRRSLSLGADEHELAVSRAARWSAAAASATAIGMLLGALGAAPTSFGLAAAGLTVGAWASLHFGPDRPRPWWLRLGLAVAAVAALVVVTNDASGVDGLLRALRGPMPDLLMALLVLHGFEVVDRRTLRVHLAIGAVIVMYASGLRIDDRVAWWLAAWGVTFLFAVRSAARPSTARPDDRRRPRPSWSSTARLATTGLVTCALAVGLLGLVPVPDGPANLGLPALADDPVEVETPGALASPDGSATAADDPGDGTRGALGQLGGYPGFSPTLDTSIRGDLGDDVVMRVRAPEPAFWRGQTFTEFDGRVWRVSNTPGRRIEGPNIQIEPTIGDAEGADAEEFVQTYYVEHDLPNIVFAAARPERLLFDGNVFARPDGALRSDVVLTAGSVYTVVSQRPVVTAESLRAQGDIAEWFAQFDDERSQAVLAPYLALPDSTSDRTVQLATDLRAGTTFDTVRAYQDWLAANTVYDLDAPVPAPGADAVDDHLFVSRRGFCEQIASSLVVMLRSQGVPARLATGYLPGDRDRVSGVWQVRARDAHAWVEVWFPSSGWQPFDPTADVPLSGEVDSSTVGADLLAAAIASITDHPTEIAVAGLLVLGGIGFGSAVGAARYRRRRGRWGVLQDRFTALADRPLTNPQVAATLGDEARAVADVLDRAAFDASWTDDDAEYEDTRGTLRRLERSSG